jgi:hypothetical protein
VSWDGDYELFLLCLLAGWTALGERLWGTRGVGPKRVNLSPAAGGVTYRGAAPYTDPMCGRYTLRATAKLGQRCHIDQEIPSLQPRFNIAPG